MRTAGLTMNNTWAHRVLREPDAPVQKFEGAEADLQVYVEGAEILHRGPDQNYRPYLHLTGELLSVKLLEPLPYDIDEVSYTLGKSDRVDMFYEFDEEQLVALTSSGYFRKGFTVPSDLTGIDWDVPGRVDALMLLPDAQNEDSSPVVFVKVHELGSLEITQDTSGYDLAEIFAQRSATLEKETPEEILESEKAPERTEAIESLFTDEELALHELATEAQRLQARTRTEHEQTTVRSEISARVAEIIAELEVIEKRMSEEDQVDDLEELVEEAQKDEGDPAVEALMNEIIRASEEPLPEPEAETGEASVEDWLQDPEDTPEAAPADVEDRAEQPITEEIEPVEDTEVEAEETVEPAETEDPSLEEPITYEPEAETAPVRWQDIDIIEDDEEETEETAPENEAWESEVLAEDETTDESEEVADEVARAREQAERVRAHNEQLLRLRRSQTTRMATHRRAVEDDEDHDLSL
jgi:hypothetical protein